MSFGTFLRIAAWGGMLAAAYLTAGLFWDPLEDADAELPKEAHPPRG